MRVFLVSSVSRFVGKERLAGVVLCRAAREVIAGTLGAGEADLGGGLFKKRLARAGGGKSGGYRAVIAYRRPRQDRVLFAYVFAKNAASTLTPQGHEALRQVADTFIGANDEQVAALLTAGAVTEVDCNAPD